VPWLWWGRRGEERRMKWGRERIVKGEEERVGREGRGGVRGERRERKGGRESI